MGPGTRSDVRREDRAGELFLADVRLKAMCALAPTECRTAVGIVFGPDHASIRLDQRARDREPESEPLLLRREERLEDLVHLMRRDAVSVIAHGDHHLRGPHPRRNVQAPLALWNGG